MSTATNDINFKQDLLIITVKEDFSTTGYKKEGYQVEHPYIGKLKLIPRILRELWFKIPFLSNSIWFNKRILKKKPKYIIVYDPLIRRDYLEWLQKVFPDAQINFKYGNMVGKANHLFPKDIPQDIRVWTYDAHDSEVYGIRIADDYCYPRYYLTLKSDSSKIKYDLIFVGKDKGRGDELIKFEHLLNKNGVKTCFLIAKDGRFAKRKYYYKKAVRYESLIEMINESSAILNVPMINQRGITLRDLEALYFQKKLITFNSNIVNYDFYESSNILVIEDYSLNTVIKIKAFLNVSLKDTSCFIDKHNYEDYFGRIVTAV